MLTLTVPGGSPKGVRSTDQVVCFGGQLLGLDAGFLAFIKTLLLMAQNLGSVGPASLLKKGTSWLDQKVVFVTPRKELAEAAMMVWKITYKLRQAQGARRLSSFTLSALAGLRRQTVADVMMGEVWPDTRTLLRLCAVLDLEITVVNKNEEI